MRSKIRYRFTALMVLVGALWCSSFALAQPVAKSEPKAQTAEAKIEPAAIVGQTRFVSLNLKQLGSWSAIKLVGADASRLLSFSVRSDEVVVAAKLTLALDYSPALTAENNHLKVSLNDKVTSIEALPQGKGLGSVREIPLNVQAIRSYNELNINLIGNDAGACSGVLNPSLWLSIGESTRLELTLAPRSLVPDLKFLPAPFLDRRETSMAKLPFVFSANPTQATLKAAGVVASWFGVHAGTRSVQFPVYLNELPRGHAVVFLNGQELVAGFKSVPGAGISVQPNPNNPSAQLLIINGTSEADLLRAARALALLQGTLSGDSLAVLDAVEPVPRKPYDAPAWLRTDRPMKFGEFTKLEELRVQGLSPEVIRINYRLPPDIFTWRSNGAPIQLKYRATRFPSHKYSGLSVSLNNDFIDSIALNEVKEKPDQVPSVQASNASVRNALLYLPPYSVVGKDQLQLAFSFDAIKLGECLPPNNLKASIDAESTIDFSAFPKYAALPNLAYFSQIGYPFTRLADLSETSVVMPERPSIEEIGLYLAVLGRMGEATGYPAVRHQVISASDLVKTPDRDLIVIGSSQNQRLLADWSQALPLVVDGGVRRIREPNANARPFYNWEQQEIDPKPKDSSTINLSGSTSLATVMGFQSPLTLGRSVVFLYADKVADIKKITDLLTDPTRAVDIQGDFVVVNEATTQHAKLSDTYYLGTLPWHNKARWFLTDNPILVAFIGLLIALLIAIALYRPLKLLTQKIVKR